MANKIQIRRGQFSGLPQLDLGEPALTTDTGQVYFGGSAGNIELKTAPPSADRTIYVATTALGGQTVATQGATGLELATGTATGTTANKLVDLDASFTADLVNKTLYNKTDDTWAKITAVDSPTQLTLSVDVMASGEQYSIASAIDNIPEAFLRLPDGYVSNVALRISPGTFADDVTFIGKNAGGNFSLSVRGSTTGTTTISGKVDIRQRLALRNLTFTNKIRNFFGADVSWYTCVTSGASKLYVYSGSANYFEGSTIIFGNDPGSYIAVSSTITKGYTMYVATTALGGDDAVADGLAMCGGTASATSANKLVDSAANFGTDVVGKAVYNSTDDTWAKITSRDSATQLSLSADIMASGEAYVIANAFSTEQKCIDTLPATVNCNTEIRKSNGTFTANVSIQGKAFSGNYSVAICGTKAVSAGPYTADIYSTTTIGKTTAGWTADVHKYKMVRIVSGAGAGQTAVVKSNTASTITIAGVWGAANEDAFGGSRSGSTPDGTSVFVIEDWLTLSNSAGGYTYHIKGGQQNIYLKFQDINAVSPGTVNDRGLFADASCTMGAYGCRFRYGKPVQAENLGTAFLRSSIGRDSASLSVFRQLNGSLQLYNCAVVDGGAGIQGVRFSVGSGAIISSFIDNNGSDGVYVERNAVVTFSAGAEASTISNNGGWGLQAVYGGRGFSGTLQTYSGNVSGTYAADSSSSIT